jgi:lipopolysaccharide export system permease protein
MLVLSALVAPAYFALNDFVVPRTNALADELKQTEIKDVFYARYGERLKHGVWYRSGNQVVEAALLDPDRGDARQITIYEVGAEGLPVSRSDARSARHVGRGVWQLIDSARIEVRDGRVRQALAPRFAELGETLPADVDTMHMSVARLARELREVEAGGYDGSAFRVALHARLAAPLACLVLPAVVLFFAAGGPPFPGPAQTLLVSGVLGAAFILLTGAATSLGHGGAVPAFVAGWAPALCYALLSVVLGFRLWRRL